MVLLFNCFLTNSTPNNWSQINVGYDRGNLKTPSKIDVVKYALSSTAKAYPWKRAIINVEIDKVYSTPVIKQELEEFVKEEFKGIELYFSHTRNKFQEDWVKTYELINDDFIYYQGNHDHIFFNSSKDYLKNFLDEVKKDNDYKYKTLIVSHWCEYIRSAKCGYIYPYWTGQPPHYNQQNPTEFHTSYNETKNYVEFDGNHFDSYNIITKELYKNWFLEGNWDSISSERIEIPRTEGVGKYSLAEIKNYMGHTHPNQKVYVPYQEIFRHFDGHFHQKIPTNISPSIDIPPGYFEKKMKIRYGYDDYKEDWTNINPKNPNYYAHDKSGVDYKFTLDDIPYIWKDRISELDINPEITEEEMLQYRLQAVLTEMYNDNRYNPHIEKSLETKVLNSYMTRFPQFNLDEAS